MQSPSTLFATLPQLAQAINPLTGQLFIRGERARGNNDTGEIVGFAMDDADQAMDCPYRAVIWDSHRNSV